MPPLPPRYEGRRTSLDEACVRVPDVESLVAAGDTPRRVLLADAGVMRTRPPERLAGDPAGGMTIRPEYPVPAQQIARLDDAWVYGHSLIVFDAAGRVVTDSFASGEEADLFTPLERRLTAGGGAFVPEARVAVVEQPCILLSAPYTYNYFHWTVEAMPRTALFEGLEALRSLPVVVSHDYAYLIGERLADVDQSATVYVYRDFRLGADAVLRTVEGWLAA